MYRVLLYQSKNGKSPISEFIYKSSKSIQIKVAKQIKYLEIFGLTKANPNLRKLSGTPFWEIRILGKDNIRIICVTLIQKEIFVINIFAKKSNKTPAKELKLSFSRYKEVIDK